MATTLPRFCQFISNQDYLLFVYCNHSPYGPLMLPKVRVSIINRHNYQRCVCQMINYRGFRQKTKPQFWIISIDLFVLFFLSIYGDRLFHMAAIHDSIVGCDVEIHNKFLSHFSRWHWRGLRRYTYSRLRLVVQELLSRVPQGDCRSGQAYLSWNFC